MSTPPDPAPAGEPTPEAPTESGPDPEPEPDIDQGSSAQRPRTRRPRRAVDPGRGPEPVWHGAAWEDDPRAWGDRGEDPESDSDERILRERPPHW